MEAGHLAIRDVIVLTPKLFHDERGFFFESFNRRVFEQVTGLSPPFVQDNHSLSRRGVLRGLHYQLPPRAQGKLVRAARGEVFDVAVDIRRSSPTFGRWVGEILSADNRRQMWIPPGFAHGFIALNRAAEVLYKTTDFHSPDHERCILWDDPVIGIDWRFSGEPLVSRRDREGTRLDAAEVFG